MRIIVPLQHVLSAMSAPVGNFDLHPPRCRNAIAERLDAYV